MKGFLSFLLVILAVPIGAQYTISGRVLNEDAERMENATVYLDGTNLGTLVDSKGRYVIPDVPQGNYTLKASFLGFETLSKKINVNQNLEVDFTMEGSIYDLDEIEINGTFVRRNMPFSHKNVEREQYEKLNLGQDVPYLLKFTPSMVVTSDAGAGVGYTGMRIRGSDPSRINVTINGVPLNDAESQLVFWVDLPDFASSAQEIQIQRGVGPSTNGTSAFGATINMNTNKIRLQPHLSVASSYGSFNTRKLNVSGGTGLMNNKISVDLRYSAIASNGYVDRATSDLNSFYGSFNYVSENSSINFNVISGNERTYQAWNGLPYTYINSENASLDLRRYNTAGTEKPGDPYENEVDDYGQHHFQLHYNKALNDNFNLNLTGHYTRGLGFYENYKGSEDLNDFAISDVTGNEYDVVIRRWLDNHFYGTVAEFDWTDIEEKQNIILGTSFNQYLGGHFGEAIWNSRDSELVDGKVVLEDRPVEYYSNDAVKNDFNTYIKWSSRIRNRVVTYLDLQYRAVQYSFDGFNAEGVIVDQVDRLHFFNPKVGVSYLINEDSKIYLSYSVANREPNRNDYTETSTLSRPESETLYDLELGYNLQSDHFGVGINLYNMQYDNQLVLTGQINDVGEYTRTNVKDSYRRGLEIDGGMNNWMGVHVLLNTTLSQNKIVNFTEYVDDWDNWSQIEVNHELTDLAFSPSIIVGSDLGYEFFRKDNNKTASVSFLTKFVGKQYIDNTSNENAELPAYTYSDLLISYSYMGSRWFKEIRFNLNIHNVFNQLYSSNAWVYRFRSLNYDPRPDDPYAREEVPGTYNLTGLYPQAGRHFLAGLSFFF